MDSPDRIKQQRDDIQSKNLMLESIINSSEAGVYVADYYTGEILFANRKTAEFIGGQYTAEELVGKTCWKALNRDTQERCTFCAYKKLVGENGELLAPYSWERYFDEYGAWAKITNQAIRWVDGRLAQITTFHDISEMKKMQDLLTKHIRREENWKMQQNMKILLDRLPIAIGITDVETVTLVYVNNTFLEMFEYPEESELLGRSTLMLLPPVSASGVTMEQRVGEIFDLKGINAFEMEFVTATGRHIDTRLTTCIVDFNNRKSSIGIITDLAAEKEQRRLLMQTAEREREANQLKSNFLSNMSHEIRTPMNAIIGLTEVELRKNPEKEAMAIYKKINSSAKSLLQIINDILDLSKIEANKVEITSTQFELEEVLNSALMVSAPRLEGKQVELILDMALDLPRFIVGDKTRLWQILRNLLDNAAKYTTHGSIVLTVSESRERSTEETIYLAFSVADTGDGMDEEQAIKAFLPYEQIPSAGNAQYAGTGLGLPISKQLCELMGGEMTAQSREGQGTKMKFGIPFTRSKNTETELRAMKQPCLRGLRVLIIDDSELSVRAVTGLLESCGASYSTACSGEEALKIVLSQPGGMDLDAVLVDFVMEGMNGLECVRQLRRILPPSVKILILTAYANLLSNDELEQGGVDGIIEKPFIPTHFLRRLTDILGLCPDNADSQIESLTVFNNARVLVCEDIKINQEVIASMLEQFNVTTLFADNGQEGIEVLDSGAAVDLVLMDLHMPVMDGYETAKAIRANPRYKDLPIISLTADAMVETLSECLAIGINDVITKPTTFEDLQRVLVKWMPAAKAAF